VIIDLRLSNTGKDQLVLLDRDATINIDNGYTASPIEPKLTPEFLKIIPTLLAVNGTLAIVTNQSGIARHRFDYNQMFEFNNKLRVLLDTYGLKIDAILICPHLPNFGCLCRKPNLLMYDIARKIFPETQKVIFIGNAPSDSDLAKNAKIPYLDVSSVTIQQSIQNWFTE
jgi:D-glycero-D-manno-heptose 1,7-bisphosphate phosphatase